MELLDMVPAHAIALRLHSLPAAAAAMGSLCAWIVAALAAAVGLWRIRAVKSVAGVRSGSALVVLEDKQAQAMAPLPPPPATDEPRAETADEPASPSVVEPSTPSKVRFTAYYGGSEFDDGVVDGVRNSRDHADDDGGEVEMVPRRTASAPAGKRSSMAFAAVPWEEKTEMALRWRGDLGWYRHLDMSVLHGSVVRLWDGELTASPRGRTRRAGLEFQLSL